MEMDCNLKKLANLFKFLLGILEKIAKNGLHFILPKRNPFIFLYIIKLQFGKNTIHCFVFYCLLE